MCIHILPTDTNPRNSIGPLILSLCSVLRQVVKAFKVVKAELNSKHHLGLSLESEKNADADLRPHSQIVESLSGS